MQALSILTERRSKYKIIRPVSIRQDSYGDDSSTLALYNNKEKLRLKKNMQMKMEKKKRWKKEGWELGESIRWVAEVVFLPQMFWISLLWIKQQVVLF